MMESNLAENKKKLIAYGPPHVRSLYRRLETFAMALGPTISCRANPKSYIGFYVGEYRGSQFLQAKVQKKGLRVVLVPACTWEDPEGRVRPDGGRTDTAYQNFLIQDEAGLPYAFTLIAQAYKRKLES